MAAFEVPPTEREGFKLAMFGLWFTVLTSGVVLFEPAPYDVLMMGMLVILAATGLIRLPAGSSAFLLPLGFYVLAVLLSCFFSEGIYRSLFYMAVTFYLLLTFVLVTLITYEDYERVTNVIWTAYLVAAIFSSILAVLGYFHLLPGAEIFVRGGRGRGLFKDPNVLGPFLVPVAVFLFSHFEVHRGIKALGALLILPLIVVGILMSFSRGAAGNLALSVLVYLALRIVTAPGGRGLGRMVWSAIVIGAIGTFVVSWVVLNTEAGHTFAFKANLYRAYDEERFAAQEEGLSTTLSWPFGIGPGMAQESLSAVFASHNLFIQVFLENGWLAGLSFFTFLGITLYRSLKLIFLRQVDTKFLVAFSSLIGLLGNSFFIDSTHWRHFFLLLALLWAVLLRTAPAREPGVLHAPAHRYVGTGNQVRHAGE